MFKKFIYLFFVLGLVVTHPVLASFGELDASFGTAGLITHSFSSGDDDQAITMTLDGSNRILIAGLVKSSGQSDMLVARFENGSLDLTFGDPDGTGGRLGYKLIDTYSSNNDFARKVLVDGSSIYIVGQTERASTRMDVYVAKLDQNGDFDTGFAGGAGYVVMDLGTSYHDQVFDAKLLPDHSLLIGGSSATSSSFDSDAFLLNVLTDGTLSTEFGDLDSSGNRLGYTRFELNPDTSAVSGSVVTTLTTDSQGNIYVVGGNLTTGRSATQNAVLAKLNSVGELAVGSFGTDNGSGRTGMVNFGLETRTYGVNVLLHETTSSTKVYVAASALHVDMSDSSAPIYSYDLYVGRFDSNGDLDAGQFGTEVGGTRPGYTLLNTNGNSESPNQIPVNLHRLDDGSLLLVARAVQSTTLADLVLAQYDDNGDLNTTSFGESNSDGTKTGYYAIDVSGTSEHDYAYDSLISNNTLYLAGFYDSPSNNEDVYLSAYSLAASCGDGVVESIEACDDGNTVSGDGCSSTCESEVDADGDGFYASEDCNDNDSAINPDAVEVCGDNIDNNCDGFEQTCGTSSDPSESTPTVTEVVGGGQITGSSACSLNQNSSASLFGLIPLFIGFVIGFLILGHTRQKQKVRVSTKTGKRQ